MWRRVLMAWPVQRGMDIAAVGGDYVRSMNMEEEKKLLMNGEPGS
jgi:hypothetical protein